MKQAIASIGIVSPRYAPAIGGVERHVEMLATGLVELGFRVEVITTDPSTTLPPLEELNGVLVRRFPTMGNDSIYYIAPHLGWWLLKNAKRYDLIHAHSYHTPLAFLSTIACRFHHVPFVVTPHYHGAGHSPFRQMLHFPYWLFGDWMLHQARVVICVSKAECSLVRQHFGNDPIIATIPNGVDIADFLGASPRFRQDGQRLVLAAGRLEKYKQFDRVIATLPLLPPEYRLVIIGDGVARSELERLACTQGIAERLRFLGHVSRSDLADWFCSADVFVNLSRHEAFGLTALESAVVGAPVVASDIAAHREIADYLPVGCMTLVPINCLPEHLGSAIQTAAHNGRKMSGGNWRFPTWADMVNSVASCYDQIIRDARSMPARLS